MSFTCTEGCLGVSFQESFGSPDVECVAGCLPRDGVSDMFEGNGFVFSL